MNLRDMPRTLLIMTVGMIVANIASSMYWPLLPLYLESLGASVQDVGLFFTLQMVLAILFRMLGGWISDHIGRLQTMALGGLVGMISIVGFAAAPTWQWALAGALFGAMGSSMVGPSFQAFTAEQAPEGQVSSTYGLVKGLFVVCLIIGPLLGGFMVEQWGYKPMLWTAVAIFAIATVIRVGLAWGKPFNFRELDAATLSRDVRGLLVMLLGSSLLVWLFVVDGLGDAGQQFAIPFLPKFVTETANLSESTYTILYALMSLTSAVAMWPGGILADRVGERVSIAAGMTLTGLLWVSVALFPHPIMFAFGFAGVGIGRALIDPAFSSLVSKAVGRHSLGMTWGLFMTAMGLLAIPAPVVGGLLYDGVRPEATFILAALACLIAAPLALWKLRVPGQSTLTSSVVQTRHAAGD